MNLQIERQGRVALIRLHRPDVLHAIDRHMMEALIEAAERLDRDPEVGCMVITGCQRAFSVGADIRELAAMAYPEILHRDIFRPWERFVAVATPKVAAVAGYALGGGFELAMMCDLIYAAESARFGQPEVKLGLIPGMGGTQRLTRIVGKARAMELILTGRTMDAREAERAGLVSRVVAADRLLEESLATAHQIAAHSPTAIRAAREAVERAQEGSLQEGLLFERRTYYALWATPDAREGMNAFLEKRPPHFHLTGKGGVEAGEGPPVAQVRG